MSGSPNHPDTDVHGRVDDQRLGSIAGNGDHGLDIISGGRGSAAGYAHGARRDARSQTVATWLALVGGVFGLHRFYLYGFGDIRGWLLWLPTLAGSYGVSRMRDLGQDDRVAWLLIPALGLVLASSALTAIVYGLMPHERWNARFDREGRAPSLRWLDVVGAIVALAVGATVLIASIAFATQRYFESQVPEVSATPAALRDSPV